jgi:hypothetical protein
MSKFEDVVRQDTPRLVVLFKEENGKEMYQWGIVGAVPLMRLIGYIGRVQVTLLTSRLDDESLDLHPSRYCEPSACVVVWRGEMRAFDWFVHPDIPPDSLAGMLETVKAALVGSQLARQVQNQQVVLGPDGQPWKGR